MSAPAIRTSGLGKSYGGVRALEGVDLSVAPGEVYGFLGRNGAGKTTTIRLLLGLLRPTAGHAEVLGVPVRGAGRGELWRRVGYLVESATAYRELTVRENLDASRRLYGVADPRATDGAMERLGLVPLADRKAGFLSTGNLQRLALARALLHAPELVILDEPTSGLDPAGVVEVRELLAGLARERGVTVFLSSHVLAEVERMASRIGVLHAGRLITELSAAELAERRGRRLEVGARDLEAAASALRAAGFAPRPDGIGLLLDEKRALAAPEEVARILVEAGAPPTRLAITQQDMEGFFLTLTREGE